MHRKWFIGFISLSILAFVGRTTGFLREIIMASNFGAGSLTDAYLTTVILFDIAIAANGAIISGTHSFLGNSKIEQNSFASFLKRFSRIALLVLGCISLLLIPIIDLIVPLLFGSATAYLSVITVSTKLLFFTLAFVLANGFLTVILQQKGNTSIPGGLTISLNISSILFLVLTGNYFGILSIPLGFLFGGIFFYLLQLYLLSDENNSNDKVFTFSSKPMLLATVLVFFNLLLPNIVAFFERVVALPLAQGVFSHYAYAGKLILLPLTILGYAVSTSLIPLQTRLIKDGNTDEFIKVTDNGILITLLVSGILVILFAVLSEPIVKLIYERGKFLTDDTTETAATLRIFSPALFAFLLLPIISNVFYSLGITKKLVAIGLTSVIINIALLFLLVTYFKSSGAIALASVISNLLNMLAAVFYLHKTKRYNFSSVMQIKCVIVFVISAVFSYGGILAHRYLSVNIFQVSNTFISVLTQLIVEASLLIAAYTATVYLFFRDDMSDVYKQLINKN